MNQLQATPRDYVAKRGDTMMEALPSGEHSRKRFMQAAVGICSNPSVARCTPESVWKAIYQCARLNLVPDPVLHHAAIVPFRNSRAGCHEATLVIEYRGLIELMKRANPLLSVKAGTVYAEDDYELVEGTENRLTITKRWWEKGLDDSGPPLFFYAVAHEPGAEVVPVIVPAAEAKKIGSSSKAGMRKGTPWHDHFERMGEKTAIRRLERFVRMDPDKPETAQFREALEVDERTDEVQVEDVAAPIPLEEGTQPMFPAAEPDPAPPVPENTKDDDPIPFDPADLDLPSSAPTSVQPHHRQGLDIAVTTVLIRAGVAQSDDHKQRVLKWVVGVSRRDALENRLVAATPDKFKVWIQALNNSTNSEISLLFGQGSLNHAN